MRIYMTFLANRIRCGAFCVLAAALIPAAGPAQAQDCAESPEAFVRVLGDQVIEITAQDLGRDVRNAALQVVFFEHVAVDAVGRIVLGRFGRTISGAQADAYFEVFPGYISTLYAGQLAGLNGTEVVIHGNQPVGDTDTIVEVTFILPENPPLGAGFRVRCLDGQQKLIDAIVQGVSMVVTKRDEFVSFLRSNSLESLIAAMERLQ
jgi:phospholipid transport system substrate-binding protein